MPIREVWEAEVLLSEVAPAGRIPLKVAVQVREVSLGRVARARAFFREATIRLYLLGFDKSRAADAILGREWEDGPIRMRSVERMANRKCHLDSKLCPTTLQSLLYSRSGLMIL